eukprot:1159654-Pelagomonas_calceolata.AAC.3
MAEMGCVLVHEKDGAGERERDKGEEEKRGKESIAKQSADVKKQKRELHEAAKKQCKAAGTALQRCSRCRRGGQHGRRACAAGTAPQRCS